MRRVNTSSAEELAYKDGGGCMALFGLPFFCMGCLFAFLGATGQMKSKGGAAVTGAAAIVPVIFGLVFACVGAVFLFGARALAFNRTRRTIRRWYGLLIPMWSKDHEWDGFDEVGITRETRRNKNNTYTVYPVRLIARGGKNLDITEPREEHEARQLAEEIAKFMNLGMADASSGSVIRATVGASSSRLSFTSDQLSVLSSEPPGRQQPHHRCGRGAGEHELCEIQHSRAIRHSDVGASQRAAASRTQVAWQLTAIQQLSNHSARAVQNMRRPSQKALVD